MSKFLAILFTLLASTAVESSVYIDLNKYREGTPIMTGILYYQGSESIEVVSSTEFQSNFTSKSPTTIHTFDVREYWSKLSIRNSSEHLRTVHLAFLPRNAEIYQGDSLVKKLHPKMKLKELYVTLNLTENEDSTFYVKANGIQPLFRPILWFTKEKVEDFYIGAKIWNGIFLTVAGLSFLVNFMILLAFRQKSYFFYLMYLVNWGMVLIWGFSDFHFPFREYAGPSLNFGLMFFLLLFSIEFLGLRREPYWNWYRFYQGLVALCFLGIIIGMFSSGIAMPLNILVGCILTPSLIYCALKVSREDLNKKRYHAYFYIAAFAPFFLSAVFTGLYNLGILERDYSPIKFYLAGALENIFMMIAIGYKVFDTERDRLKKYEKISELEKIHTDMRIQTLNRQMQPHFLFNCLNSISNQVFKSPEGAVSSIHRLSDLYRQILSGSEKYTWSLKDELSVVEDHLTLQKSRYGYRLKVRYDIAVEDLTQIYCPTMIIQTLAENSIKHCIDKNINGGSVEVGIHKKGNGYQVTIKDEGERKPDSLDFTGTGLKNTNERLHKIYGEEASLRVEQFEQGTIVKFWISGERYDFKTASS
ncbi:MAG: histidine kinase [Pseudobacteriovorax sp.]|nr:histidine kinase [Pseudobacteriovorax sp.]